MHRLLPPIVSIVLVLSLLAGCGRPSRKPEPAKPEPVLHTEAQDRKAGEESAADVARQIGIFGDPALASYVNRVGQRLARQAPHTGFTYVFQIVDQDAPNAFALPGGFIFVSRGLLVLSNSEDELANVLSHEIVHVARRHAAGRQSMMRGLPSFLRFAVMGQMAAYGRDQERESDRLGQGIAGLAGYDPQGMSNFLRQLEYTERLHLGFSRMTGYLDTHPATSERVSAAGARARSIRWAPQPGIARDRSAYLKRLDGLIIGMGAAEGVVQRDRFVHPDLGFSLRFPDSWQIVNTHAAVGAMSPQRDAQIVLEGQGGGDDPEQASAEFLEKAENEGLRVERSQPVRIGEFAGYRVEGRAGSSRGSVAVHLTWIAHKGLIFRLTAVAASVSNARAGIFHNVARSFRPITPRERTAIRETRLRVVPAQAGESIPKLAQRTGNAWNVQETAVMNGVFADARLQEGQLVKIAVAQAYRGAGPR
jgi:predicted Zn-dependent protease